MGDLSLVRAHCTPWCDCRRQCCALDDSLSQSIPGVQTVHPGTLRGPWRSPLTRHSGLLQNVCFPSSRTRVCVFYYLASCVCVCVCVYVCVSVMPK